MTNDAREPKNDRPWFQVQAAILDSSDLNRLSAEHERVLWRLIALCCRRGRGDTIYATDHEVAWQLRISQKKLKGALVALTMEGSDGQSIIDVGPGWIRIVKWSDYQPSTTSTERMRRLRAKQSDEDVTSRPRTRDVLEAEAESEEETEAEADARARQSQNGCGRGKAPSAGEQALKMVWANRHSSSAKIRDMLENDPALDMAVSDCGGWGGVTKSLGGAERPDLMASAAFLRSFAKACQTLRGPR